MFSSLHDDHRPLMEMERMKIMDQCKHHDLTWVRARRGQARRGEKASPEYKRVTMNLFDFSIVFSGKAKSPLSVFLTFSLSPDLIFALSVAPRPSFEMNFLSCLFVLFCALQLVASHHAISKQKYIVEEAPIAPIEKHISMKSKAKLAGFVSGATTGVAKGLLLKKALKPQVHFTPVAVEQPRMTVRYINVVKPVLVQEPVEPHQYYIKHEVKKPIAKKKSYFSFLKGFVGGKIVGKAIGTTVAKAHAIHA